MKSKLRILLRQMPFVLSALFLLGFPEVARNAMQNGLQLCAQTLIPGLFPFFLLSDLWIRTGSAQEFDDWFGPCLVRPFRLPAAAAPALVLGSLSGYPLGIRTTALLYREHRISRKTALQLSSFCSNAGPAFVIGVLGGLVFQNLWAGCLIYIVQLLSAALVGLCGRSAEPEPAAEAERCPGLRLGSALAESLTQAGPVMLRLCCYILTFTLAAELVRFFAPASLRASHWFPLLLGGIELTTGTLAAAGSRLSPLWQLVVCSVLVNWSGLCVHAQACSFLLEASLPSKAYWQGKMAQTLFSIPLSLLAAPLLLPLQVGPTPTILAAAAGALLFLLKISSGKIKRHPI